MPRRGGIPWALALRDRLLHKVVNSLLRRRGGGDLLAYRVGRKDWHDVRTEDLIAAHKELIGDQYTCKDLCTWNATVLAAATLAATVAHGGVPDTERAGKRLVNRAIKDVSEHLGNTLTVAHSSYVDSRVLKRFEEGRRVLRGLCSLKSGFTVPDLTEDTMRAAADGRSTG